MSNSVAAKSVTLTKTVVFSTVFSFGCATSSPAVLDASSEEVVPAEVESKAELPNRFILFATMSTRGEIHTVCQLVLRFERVGDLYHVASEEDLPMVRTDQPDAFREGYLRLLCQMPSFKVHAKSFEISDIERLAAEEEIRKKILYFYESTQESHSDNMAEAAATFVFVRVESSLSVFTHLVFPRDAEEGQVRTDVGEYELGNGESCVITKSVKQEKYTDTEHLRHINMISAQAGLPPVDEVIYELEEGSCYSSRLNLNVIASSRSSLIKPRLEMETVWDIQIERLSILP